MSSLESDLDILEDAMTQLNRAVFKPRNWEQIVARAGVQLDRPGAAILHLLASHETGNCHLRDVAKMLGVEAPSVTRKVQQLEKAGFIVRHPDEHDRRASVVKVSTAGRQALRRLKQAKRESLAEILQTWSPRDRATMAILFQRLAREMANRQN
jgi:DNA-binding MarR family transcriptional regulator